MKKQHLTLIASERDQLEALLAKGSLPARTFKRATALLETYYLSKNSKKSQEAPLCLLYSLSQEAE